MEGHLAWGRPRYIALHAYEPEYASPEGDITNDLKKCRVTSHKHLYRSILADNNFTSAKTYPER